MGRSCGLAAAVPGERIDQRRFAPQVERVRGKMRGCFCLASRADREAKLNYFGRHTLCNFSSVCTFLKTFETLDVGLQVSAYKPKEFELSNIKLMSVQSLGSNLSPSYQPLPLVCWASIRHSFVSYLQPKSLASLLRVLSLNSGEPSRSYRMHLMAAGTAPW